MKMERTWFWNRSLMRRLVVSFLILSLVIVSLVGWMAYLVATETLTTSVYDRLETVSTLKEDGLKTWVDDQIRNIVRIAWRPELRAQAKDLLPLGSDDPAYQMSYSNLSEMLTLEVTQPSYSEEVFILDPAGRVVFSTDRTHEDQSQSNASYFIKGLSGTSVQEVYRQSAIGRPTITIATPLFDPQGRRIGVIASSLSMERIDRIILEHTGLGISGSTFLVDHSRSAVSTMHPITDGGQAYALRSFGIDMALQGESGRGLYRNYAGVPVIGVYRWVEDFGVALLTEMSQEEAFAPAQRLALTIFLVGVLCSSFLTVGIVMVSDQITRPILTITKTATQVTDGNLNVMAPVVTDDEVGVLARSFNEMTLRLGQMVAGLEHNIEELEGAKDEIRTAQSHLTRIIDSISDPVFVKDRQHRWVVLNDAFCRFIGHSKEELINQTDTDIFPESEAMVFWEKDDLVFTTGKEDINEEYLTDIKGIRHTTLTKKTLITDFSGNQFIVGILRDITEQKNLIEEKMAFHEILEKRVVVRTGELENANREMESFCYFSRLKITKISDSERPHTLIS
jgi:PAS domain S-box-containing protein